jgi:hypothetical protein
MANDLERAIRELAESRARKVELAEWLTSGLRARPSEPEVTIVEAPLRDEVEIVWMSQVAEATPRSPEVAPVPADDASEPVRAMAFAASSAETFAASSAETFAASSAEALPLSETPDTLQPHLLSKELDEEDLAVLPGRPSLRVLGSSLGGLGLGFAKLRLAGPWQALERRPALKRSLAAAAMVMLLGALFLVRRSDAPAHAQTELAAVQTESALLPQPSAEPVVQPLPLEPTPIATSKPRARKAPPAPAPLADDLDGPRGPSVLRYPDLPNRVLSRLASQQDTIRRSEPESETAPESESMPASDVPAPEAASAAADVEQPTWLLDRK